MSINVKSKLLLILAVIVCVHAYILSKLIFYPYPELFIYPYLVVKGLVPYSQIIDQHFPGLLFFPVNFYSLGMTGPAQARLVSMATVVFTSLLLYWSSCLYFKKAKHALLVSFLFLLWQPFYEGFVLWIDSFIAVLTLSSFILFNNRDKRLNLLAGFLLGLAVVFKQTVAPLVIFSIIFFYYKWRDIKTSMMFIFLCSLPVILTFGYFAYLGVWKDFWFWTVIFNLTTYAKYGNLLPSLGVITRTGFLFLPLIFLPWLKKRKQLLLLLVFVVGSMFGAFDRFDFVHLQPVLPFMLLLTAEVFLSLNHKMLVRGYLIFYILTSAVWLSVFYKGHIGNQVLFFAPRDYQIARRINDFAEPGSQVFLYGIATHEYVLSQTIPAGKVFIFPFPWFLKESETKILDGLKQSRPKLVVSDFTFSSNNQLIGQYSPNLYYYITTHYHQVDNLGNIEFMERNNQ